MDVQCERCKTEYEFDDALVSGRGTTVKCTNCGLQFKVRPAGEEKGAERWIVHTTRGQALVFTSLRDLQRAITTHEVGRGDTLRRGNAAPRMLGTIAELEPFFLARPRRRSEGPAAMAGDEDGRLPTLRPPPFMSVPPSTAPAKLSPMPGAANERAAANYAEAQTIQAPMELPPPAPQVVSRPVSAPPVRPRQVTASYPPNQGRPSDRAAAMPAQPAILSSDYPTELPEISEPIPDVDAGYSPLPRRRMGGWIVAAVLLLCVGVIGYRVASPYFASAAKGGVKTALDPRAQQFLGEGETAFQAGNLELAKEKFDKASALDERNGRVLLDLARLATVRADVAWLDTRILPESPDDDLRAAKQRLADLGAVARRVADAAATAAPDDLAAIRVRIDAMRIIGERDAARGLVTKVISTASQSDTAYVLAALDLAEIDPLWSTVIERLRTAAAGEGGLGRARAALIYALVRSGDAIGAKTELDRLSSASAPHPLLADLRGFVARGPVGKAAPAASVSAAASASGHPPAAASVPTEVTPAGRQAPAVAAGGEEPAAGGGGGGSGDPRELLRQAAAAEGRGQFPKAQKLYEDAIHADPASSEALAGLGSVALKTGDYGSARSYFGRAAGLNPNYLPALVGQADALWAQGDRAGAAARYKEVVDRFSESAGYPAYVKVRAEGGGGAAPSQGSTAASGAATAKAPSPDKPPAATTELPASSHNPLPPGTAADLPGTPP